MGGSEGVARVIDVARQQRRSHTGATDYAPAAAIGAAIDGDSASRISVRRHVRYAAEVAHLSLDTGNILITGARLNHAEAAAATAPAAFGAGEISTAAVDVGAPSASHIRRDEIGRAHV